MKTMQIFLAVISVLFSFCASTSVELTYTYLSENNIDDSMINLVLYQDRLEEDWQNLAEIFDYQSEDPVFQQLQFYHVNTRKYPDLEDQRLDVAIASSKEPKGSYLLAMFQGRIQKLDFVVINQLSVKSQIKNLKNYLLESFVEPVPQISCKEIKSKRETGWLFLVYFGTTKPNSLNEFAIQDLMMHGYQDRIRVFYSDEIDCAQRMGVQGNPAFVLVQPGQSPIENSKKLDKESVFKWIATARSDVERKFTSRVVQTSTILEINALVIVRAKNDIQSEALQHLDTLYNRFVEKIKFKQDRILFFTAYPNEIAPNMYPQTTLAEYYGVQFNEDALPALMLVKGVGEHKVTFYDGIETLTEDILAEWVYKHVFYDLKLKPKPKPQPKPSI